MFGTLKSPIDSDVCCWWSASIKADQELCTGQLKQQQSKKHKIKITLLMTVIHFIVPITIREKVIGEGLSLISETSITLSGDFNIPPRHSRNLYFLVCTKQLFVTSVLAPAGR